MSDEYRWQDDRIIGIPGGDDVQIPLWINVEDHPAAVLFARLAPRIVAIYRHEGDLSTLSKDDLLTLLSDAAKVHGVLGGLVERLVMESRASGASWAELGAGLDITRSAARARYEALTRRESARGLHARIVARLDAASTCPQCRHAVATDGCACSAADCACRAEPGDVPGDGTVSR